MTEKFWGMDVERTSNETADTQGIVSPNGQLISKHTFATALKVFAAGPAGVPVGSISGTDFDILKGGGFSISYADQRITMPSRPVPSAYLNRVFGPREKGWHPPVLG